MQTVIYIRSLLQGGAEKQALLLAEEMQKTMDVLLVVHTHDASEAHQDYSRIINIQFLEGGNFTKFLSLYKILKKQKVQNLICFLPVNNILGTFAAKMAGTPNILCGIRGSRSKGKIKTFLLKFICNTLKVHFVSNNHRSREVYIQRGFNGKRISVIHNGIRIPAGSQLIARKLPASNYKITAVGRFIPEKDIPTLLQAMHTLVYESSFGQVSLNLAGYGPLENEIRMKINELNLDKHVTITDGRTVDLDNLYTESDLYVLTSAHEGMPNTIMEAMSYKLPVVATDAGDVKSLVTSNENGFVSAVGDHRAIAANILTTLQDPVFYETCCHNSFVKISNEFSVAQLADAYSKHLKK